MGSESGKCRQTKIQQWNTNSGNAITDKQIPNKSRFGELFTAKKREIVDNAIPET